MANAVKEVTQTMIEKAESLAARGLNIEQIAYSIGIGKTKLYEEKKVNEELAEAIKRGRAKGIATISNCLFESAKSGNITAQIFYLKCRAGWKEEEKSDDDKKDVERAQQEAKEIKDRELNGQTASA